MDNRKKSAPKSERSEIEKQLRKQKIIYTIVIPIIASTVTTMIFRLLASWILQKQ